MNFAVIFLFGAIVTMVLYLWDTRKPYDGENAELRELDRRRRQIEEETPGIELIAIPLAWPMVLGALLYSYVRRWWRWSRQ